MILLAYAGGAQARWARTSEGEWAERVAALRGRLDDSAARAEAAVLAAEPGVDLERDAGARRAYFALVRGLLRSTPLEEPLDALALHRVALAFPAEDRRLAAGIAQLVAERLLQLEQAEPAWSVVAESVDHVAPEDPLRGYLRLTQAEALRLAGRWAAASATLDVLDGEIEAGGWDAGSKDLLTARLHGARVQIALETGFLHQALEHLEKEERIVRRLGNGLALVAYLTHAMDLLPQLEDDEGVLRLLEGDSPVARVEDLPPGFVPLIDLQRGLSHLTLSRVRPRHAAAATAALERSLGSDNPVLRAQARRGLASLALARGDHREARRQIEEAGSELRRAGAALPVETLAMQKAAEAMVALDSGAPPAALDVLRAELRELCTRFVRVWSAVPRPPGGLDFFHVCERRQIVAELLRLIQATGEHRANEQCLELLLEVQAAGSRALAERTAPATMDELRRGLGLTSSHGCLVLFAGSHHLHLFAADDRHVTAATIAGLPRLRAALRSYSNHLLAHSASPSDDAAAARTDAEELLGAARALGGAVFADPIRRAMASWRSVTVVGSEMLGGAPPEALTWADDALFGERFAVAGAPSLPAAVSMARRARLTPPPMRLTLVAALRPSASVRARFPGLWVQDVAARDVAPITRPFPRGSVTLALDATPADVGGLDLERSAIVHFLAHGVQDTRGPRTAALAMCAGDGGRSLVRCEDLEAMTLAGLVVFASCGSALGPPRVGDDELAHLGGAAMNAGARAVVLPRSKVSLDWSREFFADVYRHVLAGERIAEALRRARARCASSADSWSRLDAAQMQMFGVSTAGLE